MKKSNILQRNKEKFSESRKVEMKKPELKFPLRMAQGLRDIKVDIFRADFSG